MPLHPAQNKMLGIIANRTNLQFNTTTIGSIDSSVMMATPKSLWKQLGCAQSDAVSKSLALVVIMCLTGHSFCQTNDYSGVKKPVQYANLVYSESLERYRNNSTNSAVVLRFAVACFEFAEFATNNTQRASLANEGIDASRSLLRQETNSAPGHYYLAMNLGQLARTKTLGALRLVDEMEREFKLASELDAGLDYAGPDRNLGELYYQAPGWPASIGSNSKARKHLERSVEIAPDYPANRLNLLEAYLDWHDKKGIAREWEALKTLMPAARTNFTGIQWTAHWKSWDVQWEALDRRAALFLSR